MAQAIDQLGAGSRPHRGPRALAPARAQMQRIPQAHQRPQVERKRSSFGGTSARTAGCDITQAYSACRSSSPTWVKALNGKAGYRWCPSRETPSRIARWKAENDQRPTPVSRSG